MTVDFQALKALRSTEREIGETTDAMIEVVDAALDLRAVAGAPTLESKALRRLYRVLNRIEPEGARREQRLAAVRDAEEGA